MLHYIQKVLIFIVQTGVGAFPTLFLLPETYHPKIRSQVASDNRDGAKSKSDLKAEVIKSLLRPFKLAFTFLPVALIALVIFILTGVFNLTFATVAGIFQHRYHFSPQKASLMFMPLTGGLVLGQIILMIWSDRLLVYLGKIANRNQGIPLSDLSQRSSASSATLAGAAINDVGSKSQDFAAKAAQITFATNPSQTTPACSAPSLILTRISTADTRGINNAHHRLPFLIAGIPLLTAGSIWYGWSTQATAPLATAITGMILYGLGMIFVQVTSVTYITDAVPQHCASALAAHTVARATGGTVIPLVGKLMYRNNVLGLGWSNTIFGIVMLATIGAPVWLMVRGCKAQKAR